MESIDKVLSGCLELEVNEPNSDLREATGLFLDDLVTSLNGIIPTRAIESLANLPPFGASWLAIVFGASIENGADPSLSGQAVVDLLRSWLEALPSPHEDEIAEDTSNAKEEKIENSKDDEGNEDEEDEEEIPMPELNNSQEELVEAMTQVCQSAVAHIARIPELREKLSHDEEFIDRLQFVEYYTHGVIWVKELLIRRSGSLLVLHPESRRGFQFTYKDVSNCFHLFSLIQATIGTKLPDGKEPDPEMAEAVLENGYIDATDTAWWHFGSPFSSVADVASSIWGEASVDSIPVIEDTQVLILWPPLLGSRTWDTGFFGPRLDAALSGIKMEEELSPEEAKRWFWRLDIEPTV